MDIAVITFLAGATAAAALLTIARAVGVKKMLKYATVVDVVVTLGLCWLFNGTLGGMLVAVLAGLFVALVLTVLKATIDRYNDAKERVTKSPYDDINNEIYLRGWSVA